MSQQVLKANYICSSFFKIPKEIDLNDKNLIKYYGIKWNNLYIEFIDGRSIIIEGDDPTDSLDIKYPNDTVIELIDEEEE